MILAAGLTPAWQQIMRFSSVQPGEVNRAAEVHWCASGKVVNVGIALSHLGAAHTLAPMGGWSGAAMRAEFDEWRFRATWIETQSRTRICTTILDDAGHATELVENARPLFDGEIDEFIRAYRELIPAAKAVVLTGSLPDGTPADFYRNLLKLTRCPAVIDARGPELLAALEYKPHVVKPNREELARTVGRSLVDREAVIEAMRELHQRGAQNVVVTAGKSPVLVLAGGALHEITPPAVTPIVNPIGCGDCLAAGVARGLAADKPILDAVKLGLAAAADNLTQLLPARLSPERVHALLARID